MLDKVVRVYVPGTIDTKTTAQDMQAKWTRVTLERLAGLFGGATAIKAEGAYLSETEGLIVEPIVLVSSFCDEESLNKHRQEVISLALEIAVAMTQECVSVEFGGIMEFVSLQNEAA